MTACDANLDGAVNGRDFIAWNGNTFTTSTAGTSGDFNSDRAVNGQDFILWNGNKFQSADQRPSYFTAAVSPAKSAASSRAASRS
jgi:hypothetical protein